MSRKSFTLIRVTLLLTVLVGVGLVSVHQSVYSRTWHETLQVSVFPINADGLRATDDYIDRLNDDDFHIINQWGVREAKRHKLALATPFNVTLGERIDSIPPPFPESASSLEVVWWGLRFRWWAYWNTPDDGGNLTRVRLFVMYYEGEEEQALAHSLGMQKGLMGLVHAFADDKQNQQNNIVITHEILHTVGAIDKYDNAGNPHFPAGYTNPERKPLYPQFQAEVMAGRIPFTATQSYMAESLRSVIVNPHTATEINWISD